MENSFCSQLELEKLGLKSVGHNVLISRYAHFFGNENIEIGSNVRIDDFCILSGRIKLGSNIHISAYTALYAQFGIEMEDYTGLSPRCTIFSASDDFSGEFFIGPMVNPKFRHVFGGKVTISRFSQIGSNCIILPGVTISEGVTVGAMSLVTKDLAPWAIYKGIPATFYKRRSNKLLDLL